MKQTILRDILIITTISAVTAQQHRIHRPRSPISFQSFDQSSGFPVEAPLRSTNVAAKLTVNSGQLHSPTNHHNNLHPVAHAPGVGVGGGSHAIPLFKQSYPGLYVKGHAANSLLKYEPTRQVSHHHGPDFSPRNVASSSLSTQQNFGVNPFSSFN